AKVLSRFSNTTHPGRHRSVELISPTLIIQPPALPPRNRATAFQGDWVLSRRIAKCRDGATEMHLHSLHAGDTPLRLKLNDVDCTCSGYLRKQAKTQGRTCRQASPPMSLPCNFCHIASTFWQKIPLCWMQRLGIPRAFMQ